MRHRVFISGKLHPDAIVQLKEDKVYEIDYQPDCSSSVLKQSLAQCHVLITRSETIVDQEVIDSAPHLKLIIRAAVGVANIDIAHATQKGILVVNTPGKNTNSAAEMTMGLLMAMLRKIPNAHQHMKQSLWDRHHFIGKELRNLSIGIVGLGNVGHRVAKFANAFDMNVYAVDPYISAELFARYGVHPCQDLMELASKVDVLTLHAPLNQSTQNMVNQQVLSVLKPGSYFINAARGGLVDEAALLTNLNDGVLAGAAIDTWQNEPQVNSNLASHPLVYCSPHIGASTEQAQKAIGDTVVSELKKALFGGVVDYPVNLPQIGVIDNPLVKPYTVLAEKLGSFAAQIIDFNPSRIDINYRGDLVGVDQALIRLGFMKGFAAQSSAEYISIVNAESYFKRLGLALTEAEDPDFQSYRSAIKINFQDVNGKVYSVGGIVFDQQHIRISLVNDMYFEVSPRGHILLIENEDKPGVIGAIGATLAEDQVNIQSFDLARQDRGEKAMAIIKVDAEVTAETLAKLSQVQYICSVKKVEL